ncbi:alpha amylase C-terminal domain-containing protein [Nocardioides sp. B-3]|nr:alpha amylase C-terminal domain-containing protein [Nocardioides sp. B-3]UUZ61710.1 alpha amylase C-terminal domain-containing protein [Nocardioides sp. B-3]
MYLTRGQPVVYYGDEQGFTGDGETGLLAGTCSRAPWPPTTTTTCSAPTPPPPRPTSTPRTRSIAPSATSRVCDRRTPALADGAQLHRYASHDAGVFAFSRIDADERREFVVALNNATAPRTVTLGTEMKQGTFKQVWPASSASVRSDAEQRIQLTVPALSAVVWRAAGTLAEREQAPALHFEKPSAGGVVGGRAPIAVAVPDGGFNQVTLAWRPVGATDWTPLGTDDNAPYRVFHDVSGLAKGTLLEYRAVLRDSSGNFSVSSTHGVVGDPTTEPPPGGGGGGGPVTQPAAVSMPGSHNSEIQCPGDWMPDCEQAQMALDANDPGLEEDRDPARRRLRVQGGHRPVVGRELRSRGSPQRLEPRAGPVRRGPGDLLLRARLALDHHRRQRSDHHPRPAACSPSSAARATGHPTACAAGSRIPTPTAPTRSQPHRCRPAATRPR